MSEATISHPPDATGPRYVVDLGKVAQVWDRGRAGLARSVEDLFSTAIPAPGGGYRKIATHYDPSRGINVIAYDDAWGPRQGDISRYFRPGEVFICVKHHKPEYPILDAEGEEAVRSAVKFDATHVSVGVGVQIAGPEGGQQAGAVTVNNPQSYGEGLFGERHYPMIFLRLTFPAAVPAAMRAMYMDNIRTWLMIANAFTNFPQEHYDGDDPLGTLSVTAIRQLGDRLLEAAVGTFEQRHAARRWLRQEANLIYCSELAHVAINLGIHYPLSRPVLGERFAAVQEALQTHAVVEDNENPYANSVALKSAPESLRPIAEVLGLTPTEPSAGRPFGEGLALRPMTMADLVREYVQLVPRETWGEQEAAPIQARLFRMIRLGMITQVGLGRTTAGDPRRQAVDRLLDAFEVYLATPAASYQAFREGLGPLLREAAAIAGPRPDGTGAFMPPHCWLLHALGRLPQAGSVMGVEVVGYGLHNDILERRG